MLKVCVYFESTTECYMTFMKNLLPNSQFGISNMCEGRIVISPNLLVRKNITA